MRKIFSILLIFLGLAAGYWGWHSWQARSGAAVGEGHETGADNRMMNSARVKRAKVANTLRPIHVDEQNALYHFTYNVPQQAAKDPDLGAYFTQDIAAKRRELAMTANEGAAAAKEYGAEFSPYQSRTEIAVVADLADWLSLSRTTYEFTGGAHGTSVLDAVLWNKKRKKIVPAAALFTSDDAINTAVREKFCAALDRERARRRDEPITRTSSWPNNCLDPSKEAAMLLGSGAKVRFDRVGFVVPAYGAGPYSEGAYEITLDIGPAIMAAVRPEYRAYFAAP